MTRSQLIGGLAALSLALSALAQTKPAPLKLGPTAKPAAKLPAAKPAPAATPATPPAGKPPAHDSREKCDLQAYVIDPDPAGLNVREAPNGKAKIVGKIPNQAAGTIVHIVASQNGWVQIDSAVVIADSEEEPKPPAQKGWVFGKMVGVSLREGQPFAVILKEPRIDGEHVAEIKPAIGLAAFLGCLDDWALVEVTREGKPLAKGWLAHNEQCDNPVTTCP